METIQIPKGKKAMWINNMLTLVDANLPDFKFKLGDKVTLNGKPLAIFTITKQFHQYGEPCYSVEGTPDFLLYKESELTPYINNLVKQFKFNAGDKVKIYGNPIDSQIFTIDKRMIKNGEQCYSLKERPDYIK